MLTQWSPLFDNLTAHSDVQFCHLVSLSLINVFPGTRVNCCKPGPPSVPLHSNTSPQVFGFSMGLTNTKLSLLCSLFHCITTRIFCEQQQWPLWRQEWRPLNGQRKDEDFYCSIMTRQGKIMRMSELDLHTPNWEHFWRKILDHTVSTYPVRTHQSYTNAAISKYILSINSFLVTS